eukprot:6864653-Prymnesium_polylepis.2
MPYSPLFRTAAPAGVVGARRWSNWITANAQANSGGSARNLARCAAHVDATAAWTKSPSSGVRTVLSQLSWLCSRTSPVNARSTAWLAPRELKLDNGIVPITIVD